jgi:glycosyltransferase involved in cell wall biosynthesis
MRILHVLPTLDPAAGGPPRIAMSLAAATARLGHAVSLLSYAGPAVGGGDGVSIETLPAPGRIERLTGRGARRALDRLVPAFDGVHLHDVWTAVSRAAMAAAVAARVPFVLLPNGMLDPWSLRQKAWKKRLVLAGGHRRLMDRAAFIHLGNVDEERGVRLAGLTAPAVIIPNGIDPGEFDPPPAPGAFHAARPELAGRPYVLFLGRLHFKKGLDHLSAAFAIIAAKYPDVQLVVAGPDDGAAKPFRSAVAAAGLADRVHLTGPIFSTARYAALAGAAVFCLPSRQEGFSIAILEAMACGTPVVVSDACHFPEVATAGAGEVVPLDPAAVAAGLDRVLSNPDRAAMGRAGRAMVLERYTWPIVAGQLVAAYGRFGVGPVQSR